MYWKKTLSMETGVVFVSFQWLQKIKNITVSSVVTYVSVNLSYADNRINKNIDHYWVTKALTLGIYHLNFSIVISKN